MWKRAFCAGFQAPRAGKNLRGQTSPYRPRRVISTANAEVQPIFLNMQPLAPFLRRARKSTLNYAATCLKLVDTLRLADFGILKWPTSAVCFGQPLDTANFYSGFERVL